MPRPPASARMHASLAGARATSDPLRRGTWRAIRPGDGTERKEARIRREIHRDRAANGGALTPEEKARINRQENRTSRQIYRAKHNDRHM